MSTINLYGDGNQWNWFCLRIHSLYKPEIMNKVLPTGIKEVMEALHYRPAVSVIMPFEPNMNLKQELMQKLKIAADETERALLKNYPDELSMLVMHKLRNLIQNLNFNTYKKSIAIYVSPVFEKVLYLDMPVEEKIIIDESFEIRDLIYSKKQLHKYLVLVISAKQSRMFIGNTSTFVRIVSNTPETVYAYMNDIPERVANFSDMSSRKEVMMEKFLHHIDNGLGIMLKSTPLPLFVMGTERITGHFNKITRYADAVIDYVHGSFDEASPEMLKEVLVPYVEDWKKVMQKDLMHQLDEAAGKNKLASGMQEVWKEAMNMKGRLLVVEKNFMYAAERGAAANEIHKPSSPYNQFSYIKDAVDDVIEKVLESGGDVEFVDEDVLKDYGRIALVEYY